MSDDFYARLVNSSPSTALGAVFDGSTDDSAALNADQAAGQTLTLPNGTAIVGTELTWNDSKLRIQGAGMYSTTIKTTGGLIGVIKQVPTGTGFASEVEICDLTLDCSGSSGSSYGIQANGATITRLTVRRVRFINCPASMITGGYAANYVIEDCVGDGAGNGSTGGTFVNMAALPMESLIVRRNKIRWANQGIVVGSSGFHSAYVEIADNDIDLGWWLIKSAFTGSGGTVTYTSGGLTDTGAAFSGIATNTTVRVMPVRQTGTLTSGSSGTFITDSAATFTTNVVKRGEIVRCGTAFAVVSKVVAQTKLHVEEWLDQTTYQPVVPPSLGASYTVYGVILGNITASTGTTLTVSHGAGHGGSAWYDLTGTELTPANGTLYEVLVGHPSYPVYCDTVTEKLQITNNRIRRGWSDGIECFGSKAVITGNIVEDGQDEGIVVQGTTGGLVASNLCKHNGTSGLDVVGSDVNIEVGPNLYQDNGWGAPASTVLGQVTISASTGVTVTGGKAFSTGEATPQYGMVISGASTAKVIGFTGVSSAVADVYVASTVSAGACQLLDIGGVIAYQGTTNGQLTRVSGTGAPSLIASPGSQFLRTDGAAGTILYVKETGNGSSGWTAYGAAAAGTLLASNNLSDVASAAASRANLNQPLLGTCQAAATANITLSGTQTIDGYAASAGDLILAAGQTTASQNGPWTVASGSWTRPGDFATGQVVKGRAVQVSGGTAWANTVWSLSSTSSVTVDTTSQAWALAVPALAVQWVTATGSYTWTKLPGAQTVDIILCAGGAGGGSGAIGITGNIGGGGGGGGAGVMMRTFAATDLPSSVTGSVGTGGAGGTAASGTSASNGSDGGAGGTTTFGAFAAASGGGAGPHGTTTTAGPSGVGVGTVNGLAGGTGGAGAQGGGSPVNGSAGGTSGGGGGGGATTSTAFNGGTAQASLMGSTSNTGTAGVAGGASPGAGTAPTVRGTPSCGGGGGAGATGATPTAQTGATPAGFGGGGGGGGGAFMTGGSTGTSGAGGAGQSGFAFIVTHFA